MGRSVFDGEFASPEENAGAIKPERKGIARVRGWLLRLADEPPRPSPPWPVPPEPAPEFAWQLVLEFAEGQPEMLRGDCEDELVDDARERGLEELFKWNLESRTYDLVWSDPVDPEA
jgi:hypothetical protein